VICPKCGETNAENFRFCGMCGAVLDPAKASAEPRSAPVHKPELPRISDVPVALRIPANPARGSASGGPQISGSNPSASTASTSGPSLLGLGTLDETAPTAEALRERAFSGSTPTFVYEDARPRAGRTIFLFVILLILATGVWIRYKYLGYGGTSPKSPPVVPAASTSGGANTQSPTAAPETAPIPPETARSAAPATPSPVESVKPPDNTEKVSTSAKEAAPPPKLAVEKPAKPAKANVPITSRTAKATAPADDAGSASFRKGEAFLYGRGVAENCDEAVRNLKAASASGNAKARSAFGTMYATGHCVPRDLPTSYSWFARALQADPNNQILEKDLTAVWNQMTPPERQLATKLKQ
jgi:cytoskeletal protein RodZ